MQSVVNESSLRPRSTVLILRLGQFIEMLDHIIVL